VHRSTRFPADDGVLRMRARRRLAPPLRRREEGFTLPELLVATLLAFLVIGATVTVFVSSIQSQPRTTSRAAEIQKARTAMENISRELRQGWAVPAASSTQLSILTYVKAATCGGAPGAGAIPCQVSYTCSTECTRTVANPDGTDPGTPRSVVAGLSSGSVFTYSPSSADPAYVGITLAFPADNEDDAITLSDGVALRNPGPPAS